MSDTKTLHVSIGAMEFGDKNTLLKTTLGSCVSVVLYTSPETDNSPIASMSHFLLPAPTREEEVLRKPLRFGSILIPHQIKKFREKAGSRKIYAKIIGGASMLQTAKTGSIPDIGQLNTELAMRIVKKNDIEIQGLNTGGTSGRSALFIPATGVLRLRIFGEKDIEL